MPTNRSARGVDATDVQRNVQFCLSYFDELRDIQRVAVALGVDRTTVERWKRLGSVPRAKNVNELAKLCGFPSRQFKLPHDQFITFIQSHEASAKKVLTTFNTIERKIYLAAVETFRHDWERCFDVHRGTYLMYCRALSDPTLGATSVLRVKALTPNGIGFDLFNRDTRQPDKPTYRYEGLMFPIAENLMYYAEHESMREPFAMITSAAQVPESSMLAGFFIAVAVHGQIRFPNGNKVALRFRARNILDVDELRPLLGLKSFDDFPDGVKKLLSPAG